ncbi:Protein ZINC INDUCED FACILITATOR-like 1 [Vitis vinifera]|uniref:Protein ZINC INDUCED FACILITATOR-like 1 n=1 Tax=Vitis vinifera TaxID=29760 RepID=A0A438EB01_VITVI|nr:Protein ZINC INDUCED FACILITATOR-like 1 [Vitis vinifera]
MQIPILLALPLHICLCVWDNYCLLLASGRFLNQFSSLLHVHGITSLCYCCLFTAFDIQISGLTQETLHTHNENDKLSKNSYNALEAPCGFNAEEAVNEIEANKPTSKESLIKNWPLMSSIIVFCVFSLHDMAYSEVCLSLSFRFWNIS